MAISITPTVFDTDPGYLLTADMFKNGLNQPVPEPATITWSKNNAKVNLAPNGPTCNVQLIVGQTGLCDVNCTINGVTNTAQFTIASGQVASFRLTGAPVTPP